MSDVNNVTLINQNLKFTAYELAKMISAAASVDNLRTQISHLFEKESVYADFKTQVEGIAGACITSRSKGRQLAETLKLGNAQAVETFNIQLSNAASTAEARDEFMQELASDYAARVVELREAYTAAVATLAPAHNGLPAQDLQKEHARLTKKSQDDQAITAQKQLIERCTTELAKLEAAKAQLDKGAAGGVSNRPDNAAEHKPLKELVPADVLQLVANLYANVDRILQLADLLNGIKEMRTKLARLNDELKQLENEQLSWRQQLKLVEHMQALDEPRKAFVQEMDSVLDGVRQFVEACEAPEADLAARVARFTTHALSLDAYLAPLARG